MLLLSLSRLLALRCVLTVLVALCTVIDARVLWDKHPANLTNLLQTAYPLGNGKLGGW
jgi:hypothetical protein